MRRGIGQIVKGDARTMTAFDSDSVYVRRIRKPMSSSKGKEIMVERVELGPAFDIPIVTVAH
jgi:hypothetical protein